MADGILSMGTMVPERKSTGNSIKNDMRSACWRFRDSVDTKTPIPMLVKRKIVEAKKNRGMLPLIGSPKPTVAIKRLGITIAELSLIQNLPWLLRGLGLTTTPQW